MATPTATPVPPLPTMPVTCRILGVVSFTEGLRNGEPYDETTIDEIVANFQNYNKDFWLPYVTVNHEKSTGANPNEPNIWEGLSLGDVVECRKVMVDGKAGFEFDCINVPTPIGQLYNSNQLRAVSVEWFDPAISPFIDRNDQPVMTKVMKCLTLVGSAPEASKGMPKAVATFTDRAIRKLPVRKFVHSQPTGKKNMDRASILAALKSFGVNVDSVTDAIPDDFLKSILDSFQGLASSDPSQQMRQKAFTDGTGLNDPNNPAVTMNQGGGGSAGAAGGAAPVAAVSSPMPTVGGTMNPQSVTLKFRDRSHVVRLEPGTATALQEMLTQVDSQYRELQASMVTIQNGEKNRSHTIRSQKIAAFRDEMTKLDKEGKAAMTPVQFAAIQPQLERCDVQLVRKFADGKETGTELDEQFAVLRNSFKPVKRFGQELADPAAARGANGSQQLDPAERDRLLAMTHEGRAAIRNRQAAASKN